MQTTVTTTITTTLDLDTMKPSHAIDVSHEGVLPLQFVYAIARGGASSILASIDENGVTIPADPPDENGERPDPIAINDSETDPEGDESIDE